MALRMPLLVFSEPGISGGIFDVGSGDLFIHDMPVSAASGELDPGAREALLNWQARVRQCYRHGTALSPGLSTP